MIETSDDGSLNYITGGGISVRRVSVPAQYDGAIDRYIDGLNERRGAVFSSNYEYPGRYTRWDTAIIDPPIMVTARGRDMEIEALNARGEVMLAFIHEALCRDCRMWRSGTRRLRNCFSAWPSRRPF